MIQVQVNKRNWVKAVKHNSVFSTLTRSPRVRTVAKIGIDYAFTLPALFFISPLLLFIAFLIKLESPGPVFYRQRVLGLNGREFYAYKFRTMYVNANEVLLRHRQEWVGMLQGRPGARDPRLTRVGFFLRQSGLDELPRLFNILTRDMSLVGPKAITRREIMRYGRRRVDALTSVMPGLTGLWQLHSQKEAADERVNLELEYINNWSPWLDIKILFGTLTAVWKHQAQGAF